MKIPTVRFTFGSLLRDKKQSGKLTGKQEEQEVLKHEVQDKIDEVKFSQEKKCLETRWTVK